MTAIFLSYRTISRKITAVNLPRLDWKLIYCLSIVISLFLMVFYVYLVHQLTQGAFLIKNYNKIISGLLEEKRGLETDFAKAEFLENARERAGEMSFEKMVNVKYVHILDKSIAKTDQIK